MIQTERLLLPLMSERFLEACLDGDVKAAEAEIGLTIPEEWFARKSFIGLRLAQLRQDETFRPFSPRAITLKNVGEMVGDINFHTPPDPAYLREMGISGIELGYTVFGPYRRQGYAQEALLGLMRWAHQNQGVKTFVVSVSPQNTASVQLTNKLGFMKVAEQLDPEDGLEEVYVLEGGTLQAALAL